MRAKRLLLATTALLACKKPEPRYNLPGNPKGTFYDASVIDAAPPTPPDAGVKQPPKDAKDI